MMNVKTGAAIAFKIASVGGMGAIAGEVASFGRNRHLGYPIVTLSTGSYKTRSTAATRRSPCSSMSATTLRLHPASRTSAGAMARV